MPPKRAKKRGLSARAVARLPKAQRNSVMLARSIHKIDEVLVAPAAAEEQAAHSPGTQ